MLFALEKHKFLVKITVKILVSLQRCFFFVFIYQEFKIEAEFSKKKQIGIGSKGHIILRVVQAIPTSNVHFPKLPSPQEYSSFVLLP